MSTFLRATDTQADLQAMALAALGAGNIILPIWYDKDAWLFPASGSALTDTAVSGIPTSGVFIGVSGFVAAMTDGASGAYLCQHVGSLVHYASGGALTAYTLASGVAFVGGAYDTAQSAPYVLQETGTLYTLSGASLVAVSPNPAFGSSPYSLHASGAALFTMLAAVSGIGKFTLGSLTSGSSGVISVPMSNLLCMAVSSGAWPLAAGGWNQNSFASGFTSMSVDPVNATFVLGVTSGTGILGLWQQASGSFAFNQAISGLSAPSFVQWAPTATTAFVCDPVGGHVYDISYTLNTLAIAQTIALSGATQAAFTPAVNYALVTQPSHNQVSIYQASGASWVASGTIPLNGATSILSIDTARMAIGYASGIAYASLVGSAWSITSSGALPFTPNGLAMDVSGNIYAAGNSGSSGLVAILSGTSLLASGSWVGSGNSILLEQGQIVVADIASSLLRIFAPSYSFKTGSLQVIQANSYNVASGLSSIAFSTPYFLAAASGITRLYQFGSPYSLSQEQSGVVTVYNGASWAAVGLGSVHTPEAMTFDPSGNISVATLQNDFYTISPSGASVLSRSDIFQEINQPQTTPIGISKLLWLNGHLYGATSLNDSMVEIV